MEAEVTLRQEYERGLPPADLHQLPLQGKVKFFTNCSLRVYLSTNTSLIVMLRKNKKKNHFRNREPQCTCSHPEPLAQGTGAGVGGKQRQGGPGAAGGVAGEPHRMRGQLVMVIVCYYEQR